MVSLKTKRPSGYRWTAKPAGILVLLGLLLPVFLACAEAPSGPDILLITVDALRPDHLGLYGYARETSPNLDHWFSDGLIFDQAYATQSNTAPSIISLLTGQYPQEHGVRLLYQLVPRRSRLLTGALPKGYQSAAFVSNFVLTDEATGLAAYFDHYDDFMAEAVPGRPLYERGAGPTTDAALQWLAGRRDPKKPLFLWVHYIDPHGPYLPPETWLETFDHPEPKPIPEERIPGHQKFAEINDGLEYVDRYDEEIAYVDREIGRLLEGYSALAGEKEPLLIFTADHGESMMEHEKWFSHGYHVYEEIMRVPLMIQGPGVTSGRRQGLVSGIDLAPTVLGLLGTAGELETSGVDLLAAGGDQEGRILFAEATRADYQWRLALQGERRWMAKLAERSKTVIERRFYDLGSDGGQDQAMPWEGEDPVGRELLTRISEDPDPAGWPVEMREGIRLNAPKVAPRADAEALERLRALGYVN